MISPSEFVNGNGRAPALPLGGPVGGDIEPLEFLSMTMPRIRISGDMTGGTGHGTAALQEAAAFDLQFERQRAMAEQDAARLQGRAEGRKELEDELERRIDVERMQVVKTCVEFRVERDVYFGAVETEVVKLALAIAARVLHREVQLDPMLLRAVVKVALGKLAEQSDTVLRVPELDAPAWRQLIENEHTGTVQVAGDVRLTQGECILETVLGRVELGIGAQMEEIEKGFFDLLQQRPA